MTIFDDTVNLNDTVNDGGTDVEVDGDGTSFDAEQSTEDTTTERQAATTEVDSAAVDDEAPPTPKKLQTAWLRVLAYGVLPGVILLATLVAGYLKWVDESAHGAALARVESLQAAKDGAVALLSYKPDTVEKDLGAASDRLTGDFKDAYTALTHDVVVPGAKQKNVTAVATVAAAASVSATEHHAVALVFVDQTVTIATEAPTATTSALRVVLDKTHGRWLISRFDPV